MTDTRTVISDGLPSRLQLLASGVAMTWATHRERAALRRPGEAAPVPYVRQVLEGLSGPVVAVSDRMRAVPDRVARWVLGDRSVQGTDGLGFVVVPVGVNAGGDT